MSAKYFVKLIKKKKGEKIIRIIRRYGLTLWFKVFLILIFTVLDFFFLYFLFSLGLIGVIIFFVVLLSVLIYAFTIFRKWYYNAFLITNRRIIDIDQRGIFERAVTESPLLKIKDISYRIKGLWQMIFKYGTLEIYLESDRIKIKVSKVKNPRAIQNILFKLKERLEDLG